MMPTAGGFVDRIADGLAQRICRPWSPLDRQVWIAFDDSRDAALAGVTVYGCVRGWNACDGLPNDLLIELDRPFTFGLSSPIIAGTQHRIDGMMLSEDSTLRSSLSGDEIRHLVTRPCLVWRRTPRIIFSWTAVRIVAASSFADAHFDRTIGTGRIGLRRR
jgi:hypothetical protein